MPTDYTPIDTTFYDVIPLPSDSDLRNSNSMGIALQPMCDNTAWIKAGMIDWRSAGSYAPSGGIMLEGSSGGLGVADGCSFLVGVGGYFHSDPAAFWDGTFSFVGGAITLDGSSSIEAASGAEIRILSGAKITMQSGSACAGAWTFGYGVSLTGQDGSSFTFEEGSGLHFKGSITGYATGAYGGEHHYKSATVDFDGYSTTEWKAGHYATMRGGFIHYGNFTVESGGALTVKNGGILALNLSADVTNGARIKAVSSAFVQCSQICESVIDGLDQDYNFNSGYGAQGMPQILLMNATTTVERVVTLPSTGAQEGQTITISADEGSSTISVRINGAVGGAIFIRNDGGFKTAVKLVWAGGNWRRVMRGPY